MVVQLQSISPSSGVVTTNTSIFLMHQYYTNEPQTYFYSRFIVSQNPDPFVSSIFDSGIYIDAPGDAVYSNQYYSDKRTISGLAPGTYYWKVQFLIGATGAEAAGSPSVTNSFVIQDVAPTATQSTPLAGASISWPDNSNYPLQFTWNYSGGSNKTAHQVVVERVSDGVVIVDSGKVVNSNNTQTLSIPLVNKDVQLRWKVRVWNAYDTVSAYTSTRTFTLATVPTVTTAVSPLDNQIFSWVGGSPYQLSFQWTYSGSGTQSQYRIVLERASDGFVVSDSGLINGSSNSATIAVPISYRDVPLRWKVLTVSQYGLSSPYTTYRTVKLYAPPSVSITSPTVNQVLSVGTPDVSGVITTALTVNKIVASLWDGVKRVWEKTVTGSYINGASYNITDTNFFMTPNITYTYRVEATDTQGVISPTTTQNFSVNYTAPVTPGAVTVVTTNYAESAYVSVSWPDTGRDADFYAWEVEREDSLLDHNTGAVLSIGAWKKIGTVYTPNAAGYTFQDYLAPANYSVRYRVRQVSLKFNTQVFGAYNTSASNSIFTSAYWLIAGINGAAATITTYKIYLVNSDSYTEETESNTFNLIGRGRYDEKGTSLGVTGSLGVQFRDNPDGTARQKKLALDAFILATPKATLRNPFGDAFYVSVGNISFTRIPGVGKAEYTDATIPYSEVAF